jgi:phage terminase large subunit-like protein
MYPKTMSRYYCLSGDHHRSEGINASSIIFDETHTQKDSRLWDAVRYATASQRDPLLLSLSTAGAEKKPGLPWWDLWTYCERVAADPSVDPRFYGKIYEAPEVEDEDKYFTDEKMWRSANPSLGETITLDSFRADAQEAKNTRTRRNAFLRYRLNRPVALDGRFINMGAWARNAKEWSAPLEGRECFGALDLASTRDLSCFLCLFPWENGEGFDVFSKFWVPSDSMRERCVRDGVQYDRWNADGHLETTTGNVTDYNYIRKFIVDFSKKHNVKKIAVDRWAAQSTIVELAGEGVEMLGWGQGFASMSEGTKLLETYLEQEKLFHKGHPVLEWNASNLCVDEDAAGNIKPSRKRSTEKIDGMVCLSMAIGLHATTEKQASQDWNIYEL